MNDNYLEEIIKQSGENKEEEICYDLLKNFKLDNVTNHIYTNSTNTVINGNTITWIAPTTTTTTLPQTWTTTTGLTITPQTWTTTGAGIGGTVTIVGGLGGGYAVNDPDYNLKNFGYDTVDIVKKFRDLPKEKLVENKKVREETFECILAYKKAYKYIYALHGINFINILNVTLDDEITKKLGTMDFEVRDILLDAVMGVAAKIKLSQEEYMLLTRPMAMLVLGA